MGTQPAGLEPQQQAAVQVQRGRAAGQVEDFASTPAHGLAQPQPDGLAEGFLGAKARGQVAQAALGAACAALLPDGQLLRAQHTLGQALAVALQRGAHAPDVAHIGADAKDHGAGLSWLPLAMAAR